MPGYSDLCKVFCSFLIACLAGFVAFESVDHTRYSKAVRGWVFFGGVTLGLRIWSMHFMGMLAWHPPFALYYSVRQNTPVGSGRDRRVLAGPAPGGGESLAKIAHCQSYRRFTGGVRHLRDALHRNVRASLYRPCNVGSAVASVFGSYCGHILVGRNGNAGEKRQRNKESQSSIDRLGCHPYRDLRNALCGDEGLQMVP